LFIWFFRFSGGCESIRYAAREDAPQATIMQRDWQGQGHKQNHANKNKLRRKK